MAPGFAQGRLIGGDLDSEAENISVKDKTIKTICQGILLSYFCNSELKRTSGLRVLPTVVLEADAVKWEKVW